MFTSRARVTKMSMAYGRYSKQYRARHGVIGCCRRSSNRIIHGITLTITIFSLRVADRTGAWKLVAVNPCLVEGATIFMNGWANDVNWFLETTGSLPNQYLQLTDDNWMQVMGGCNLSFAAPTADLLNNINNIMFRLAISASNSSTIQQMPPTQTSQRVIFRSHYRYLGETLTVVFVAVLVIIPTFNGWWMLQRRVTLSPIETARAFGAPIIQHPETGGNSTADACSKTWGMSWCNIMVHSSLKRPHVRQISE